MADAAAKASAPSDAVERDGSQRRPPLLGRSPLRVLFRVAQVTLLLWAVAILVERYDSTGTEPIAQAGERADLVLGDQALGEDFDGPEGSLPDGWDPVAGNWVVSDSAVALVPDPSGTLSPALLTHSLPESDRIVVQTTVTSSSDGIGLVYDYNGPTDFYRLSFNPTFAAAGLERIDVSATVIERFAPIDIPSTYEISLEFANGEVQVWIGNTVLGQVSLKDGRMPTSFGLSSSAGSAASFDSVRVYTGGI